MRSSSSLLVCVVVLVALVALQAPPPVRGDVGNLLYRTFLVFADQPLNVSDALSAGWSSIDYDYCDPNFGIAFSAGTPSAKNTPILYFTAGGQLAGFGERVFGQPPQALIDAGFWRYVSDEVYDIIISTRDTSLMCSGDTDPYNPYLGDRLMINQQFEIPLTMSDAENAGWVMGNCITKMGIHHAYDLNAPGSQTWNVSSLVPVLPMYNADTQAVSAVLFWMPDLQDIEPLGEWEGPFIPSLFCKNWCSDSGCNFDGVTVFTTNHWMFTDPDLNTCGNAPCAL